MTAIVAVLLRFAIENYEHSSYYLRNRNVEHLQQPLNYKVDEIHPPAAKKRRLLKMPKAPQNHAASYRAKMSQSVFKFAAAADYSAEKFLISESNRARHMTMQ